MKPVYFCSSSAGNCSRSICCSSTYIRCTGLAATSVLSKLKTLDKILNAKRVRYAAHALVDTGVVAVLLDSSWRGSVSFRLSPS